MFRFQPPLRQARLSAVLALALMGVGASAAETSIASAANAAADQAAKTVDRAASEMSKVQAAFQESLGRELSRLNQRYDDVKKELEEEYVGLTHDKEAANEKIFNRLRDLTKRKDETEARIAQEYAKVKAEMQKNGIPAQDKRYTDAIAAVDGRKSMIDGAYDSSRATLQQLYQLTNKRFNELEKIQTARETLETNRHREERDLTAQRLGNEAHSTRSGLTEDDRRNIEIRNEGFKSMQKGIDDRYHNSLNALDEYKTLVNRRMKDQAKYEAEHLAITQGLADADLDSVSRGEFIEHLNTLDRTKDLAEQRYQNSLRFVEEKLGLQNRRNREMSRLNDYRRDIEENWSGIMADYRRQRATIETQLKQASASDLKAQLEKKLSDLKEGYEKDRAAYDSALKNLGERRKLMEKSMDDQLSYLKERNNIRLRMSENPMNAESLEKYRSEIGALEENRMDAEQKMRDRMTELYSQMPTGYRDAPWKKGNPDARRDRMAMRMGKLRQDLENSYQAGKAAYKNKVEQINAALAVPNIDQTRRTQLQAQMNQVEQNNKQIEEQYAKAKQALDARAQLEERRMASRAAYMQKRLDLWRQMNAAAAADKSGFTEQLRALDSQWLAQERAYRGSEEPLASLLPDDHKLDAQKQDEINLGWSREMEKAENMDKKGTIPTETSWRDERSWQKMKSEVADAYQDAVTYLTD